MDRTIQRIFPSCKCFTKLACIVILFIVFLTCVVVGANYEGVAIDNKSADQVKKITEFVKDWTFSGNGASYLEKGKKLKIQVGSPDIQISSSGRTVNVLKY